MKPTPLIFLLVAAGAVWPGAVSMAGLIGHWAFEDGSGESVADSSGLGHHGQLINGKPGTWTSGRLAGSHALYLDGTTGPGSTHVTIANTAALQPTAALSVAAWVRLDDAIRDAPILAKEGNGQLSYWFGTLGTGGEGAHPGSFGLLLDLDGNQPWSLYDRNQGYAFPGVWQHIVSTWDGAVTRHYLNGVALPETASLSGALHAGVGPLIIGANVPYNTTAFQGALDEVRLYNHALSAAEVTALYGESPRLVGHWTFDEGGGTVVHDHSGLGNHGELINPKPGTWTAGHASGAVYFDGTLGPDATYVRIEDAESLRLSGGLTCAAWIRSDDMSRDAPILAKEGLNVLSYWFGLFGLSSHGSAPGNFGVLLSVNGSHPWTLEDRNQGTVPVGEWVHLASTWDGMTVRHYLRGEPLAETASFTGPIRSSDAFLAIGVNSLFTFADNRTAFNGAIDDVALYNYALSPDDIRAAARLAPFRLTAVVREGRDLRLTWTCQPGRRYVVQTSPLLVTDGHVVFTDLSNPIDIPDGYSEATIDYVDRGAMDRGAALYYRVTLVPKPVGGGR